MATEYDELRIRVWKIGTQRYFILANGPQAASAVITLKKSPDFYRNELNELMEEEFRRKTPSGGPVTPRLEALGMALFQEFIPNQIHDCLKASFDFAKKHDRRLRLRFDLDTELLDIPFELLHAPKNDPLRFLIFDSGISIVRSLPGNPAGRLRVMKPDANPEPLSLFIVVSSPKGWPKLDVEAEISKLTEMLEPFRSGAEWLSWEFVGVVGSGAGSGRATRERLTQRLQAVGDKKCAALVISHGRYDKSQSKGFVILETDKGSPDEVPDDLFAGLLSQGASGLRFVALNLCEGAKGAPSDPFSGAARALIAGGIPAVVGMKFDVSEAAAAKFSPALLKHLCQNTWIDEACMQGRFTMARTEEGTTIEWSTAELFLHKDFTFGWLFKVPAVRRRGKATIDPLKDYEDNLTRIKTRGGDDKQFAKAIQYVSMLGHWEQALNLAELATQTYPDDKFFVRMNKMGLLERGVDALKKVCSTLANEQEPPHPDDLGVLQDNWQIVAPDVLEVLEAEVSEALELDRQYKEALREENRENWKEATRIYEQILKKRPAGYQYVRERLERAKECVYHSGLEAERHGKWAVAAQEYACLPEDYKDVRMRLPYASGRAAEHEDKWLEVVVAYERLPLDWKDVKLRLPYAQGRAAEQGEKWEEAVAAYETIEPDYEDVHFRLPYCRGRAAEEQEDWKGVINGFGALSDTYRDVGPRRSYARGRKAEAEGNWAGVIEGFAGLPAEYRDVAERRCYAQGRRAAELGSWEGVIRGFGELPDDYYPLPPFQDDNVGNWRCYVQGRIAEAEEKWEKAVEAFQGPPNNFKDVKERLPYAKGRAAEQQENWEEVIAAFQNLPDTSPLYREGGVGERIAYATGRIAIQKQTWAEAVKVFEGLLDLRDAPQFLQYAKGRAAEEVDDWAEALEAFKGLPDEWIEARQWRSYAQGRVYEALGAWRAALEEYRLLFDDFKDLAQRRRRLGQLLQVAPWLDGLTRAHLVRDPDFRSDGVFPYDALSPAGITPDSAEKAVKDASFVLMEKGLMTPEGRLAWDQLRNIPGRLKVDALMYPLRRVEDIRSLQQRLEPISEPELVRQVCNTVPEDGPLMLLLSGRREAAISAWKEQQRQKPNGASAAHALAVVYLCRAKELEAGGAYEQGDVAWEHAIANWAFLLTDDTYWLSWQRDRAAFYQEAVSESDIAYLRSELGEYIAKELAQYANRYLMEGRRERAAKCQQLAFAFEVELEGARALKELGGLSVEDGKDARPCCGLVFVHNLKLEQSMAKLILDLDKSLERESEEPIDVIAALEAVLRREEAQPPVVTPKMLHRLRCTFSELGKAVVLLERQRHEEALQALPAEYYRYKISQLPLDCDLSQRVEPGHLGQCKYCQMFARSNPAYLCLPHRSARLFRDAAELAVQIHLAIAQSAITSGGDDLGEPLKHWEQAINVSRNVGTQVRTKRAIGQVALGRANALSQQRGPQRGRRLTEGIDLLEAVRKLVGGVDEAQLRGKQSELLANRGIWYGYVCQEWEDPDYKKAVDDLRQALKLNPDSLFARDDLAHALIFYADDLHYRGQYKRPMGLLAEALSILDKGLRRFANHAQLQKTLQKALEKLEELSLSDQSMDEPLRRLENVVKSPTPSSDAAMSRVQELVKLAKQKLEAGDVSGAILNLIEVVRLNPSDESARQELLLAVQCQAG